MRNFVRISDWCREFVQRVAQGMIESVHLKQLRLNGFTRLDLQGSSGIGLIIAGHYSKMKVWLKFKGISKIIRNTG